jgi:pyruvate/2-oxoglutarate dehydrogenase complex dihydrolipoamide dehydrogenase (E3) component
VLPARVLAHTARLKRESGQLGVYGLRATEAELDWPAALRRLFNVVEALHVRKEIAEEARKLGVDIHENVGETRLAENAFFAISCSVIAFSAST